VKLYTDVVQRSPAWWDLRRGRPTASEFHRILTPAKEEYGTAGVKSYIHELCSQTFASWAPPVMTETPNNPAMRHGERTEPEARRYFEMETGYSVATVGFVTTDDERFGCSPDGLLNFGGAFSPAGLELKCPQPHTQVKYLLAGVLPREYKMQVHGSMAITGADHWHFLSYAPCMDPLLLRVERSDLTDRLAAALDRFWEQYTEALATLHKCPVSSGVDVRRLIRRGT
jgi:hypothetical protein